MSILNSPQRIDLPAKKWKVFLAGPIQGASDWQNTMPDISGVLWMSPRRISYENFNYPEQTSWEHDHLQCADVILFWIPERAETIEGRDYAQTTRTEFGEYLALGKKIIFGCYSEFPGKRYFQTKLEEYNSGKVLESLEECMNELMSWMTECEKSPKTYYTSDTHFGDPRAFELSKRPFKTLELSDWTIVRNWNNTVHPCDTIYHLGDFGDQKYLSYLSGTINLIYGNYERDGKYEVQAEKFNRVFKSGCNHKGYILCHEPLSGKTFTSNANNTPVKGVIFGHIHGRQKIKPFGIDCGVDGCNYRPISQEEVDFYLNAIEKGYYDKEVWS